MFSLRHLLLIVALVLVSSTITHAQSPKRCTKPRWKRAITTSASPYLTGSMTGASQAVLAEKCRRKCMADAPCMVRGTSHWIGDERVAALPTPPQ